MKNLNSDMVFNHKVAGNITSYEAWEIRPSQIENIECENFILLICYVTLPKKYHHFYCKFHHYSDQISKLCTNRIIYSYLLIPTEQVLAQAIIDDIILCN
ncbi:hypothetical protein SAMN04487935_1031 [Flavobacterium noncentrifugens]|uniref:Uncharacterized protein n=1 Tax=Flavobacterium noncentrifugens TaxID=1128970 RepID=A0A1G8USF1_9FLAO|nr:hypothetical protein SAMN04487935_1031 [Flavobacterium noncentrifugens]